jgi:ABC-2 type transport system permease protein
MPRLSVIVSFLKKEFSQMFRDPKMLIVLFAAPVIMLLLFGYAVSTDVKDVRIVVYDEDRTALSRNLVEKFTASGYFHMESCVDKPGDADRILDAGDAEVYLHIENGFDAKVKSGKSSPVQAVIDGTDSGRAAVILSYVNTILSDFSFDYFQGRVRALVLSKENVTVVFRKDIELKERVLYNPELSSRNFYLPGILGLLISMVTVVLTAMSIVKERETGTIDQLIVAPLTPLEVIAGKTVPFVIISFADIVAITILAIFWFKVPFHGSFLFLLLSSFIYIFSATAVGLFISTISRTQQQALLSTFLYFLPSVLLSGFVFPVYAMPDVVQWITYINPMRYYITIVRGVFMKGAGMEILWKEVLIMLILGTVLLFLSARRFSRRLE